ncbi:hypothetical protein B0H14DRAFT_2585328 [Mycena olivaceomarginata]|nr:hypothetical protein B0H14DRAFT_2585328 [Mycena olivaceomarginata]
MAHYYKPYARRTRRTSRGSILRSIRKQQELELLKRRMGVRGTAGLKPASKIPRRRDSAVFKTRSIGSRAPSLFGARPGPRKGPSSVPPLVTCRICLDDVVSRAGSSGRGG